MAVNFGEHASGFRHNEVIWFINNEILMNGGSSDFYMTFHSRPWNEVEDGLRAILADPQVPHALKRACTLSALALSVRVGERQREQQVPGVQFLREQMEEREVASRALVSQLQWLRVECEEVASQLQCAKAALCQAIDEREVLRGRLVHVERLAQADPLPQEVLLVPGAQQLGAAALPMHTEEQGNMVTTRVQGMPHLETQMAAPAAVLYMPGPQSPWAQTIQPPLPMPGPHPFPFHASLPMGSTYSTPLPPSAVWEAETAAAATATAVAPQMPPPGICPPGLWAAVEAQEKMALLCDQRCYCQGEYSEILQAGRYLGDTTSQSQEEGPVFPQEITSLCDIRSHSQKECPVMFQDKYPLGNSESHSREKNPVMSQKKYSLGNSKSHSQKEGPVMSQKKYPLGNSKSHSQEEGPERFQEMTLHGGSKSSSVSKSSKKQQPQGKKAKQPKGKRASESQYQEMSACYNPKNWNCPWCKGFNFSWRKACYRCKKVYIAVESGDLDPGQTH
ncbi:hypothetical protein mRhiFer1_007848 [Rhinolophus ferrumequinum]|uniref:RanBP2-type domain-containing protein n=1 Tax=Rhinolophus ferrumequinum TaxID=59479 RepID=A0A7J8AUP2_RHIFE|nr:putative testis-expressed protein 13C [Rhinolophus ferrumequinum]KAF6390273.1 hypothetical protein mRhiFer1_007848 [Rhinolophus ferrumequinum]